MRKIVIVALGGLVIAVALATSRSVRDNAAPTTVSTPNASAPATAGEEFASAPQTSITAGAPSESGDAGDMSPAPATSKQETEVLVEAADPVTPAEAAAVAAEAAMAAQEAATLGQDPGPGDMGVGPLELGAGQEKPAVVRGANATLQDVRLAFKLDPRLTAGLYMGERWVSPPTYIKTGEGETCTLEATVRGMDNQGQSTDVNARWTAADPGMVTVAQGPGKVVQITVHHAGQTSLEVASVGFAKRLPLKAMSMGETLVVEVYQQ